jgi:hypothetical protein
MARVISLKQRANNATVPIAASDPTYNQAALRNIGNDDERTTSLPWNEVRRAAPPGAGGRIFTQDPLSSKRFLGRAGLSR